MPNAKKNQEEWNDGTLEYWVRKKFLAFFTLFHHSTIPLFQSYFKFLSFDHSFGFWILTFEL